MKNNPIAVALKEHLEEKDASLLSQEAMEDETPIIVACEGGTLLELESDEMF